MEIERAITRTKFSKSNNFKESKVIIKKIGNVSEIANFFSKNVLNKKKKKPLTMTFIINMKTKLVGGIKKL